LSLSPQPSPPEASFRFSHRQSIGLVLLFTLFAVAAQALIKSGATSLHSASVFEMLTNRAVFFGYALYGFSTILLILALRDGELSLLYPVISLTYVWVTILSVVVFHEPLTLLKVAGIAVICAGVALLGVGGGKK
jgi:multidrug transporter EmrE-like cation transporter